jgi:hypothetical protein
VRGDGEVKYGEMMNLTADLGEAGFSRATPVTNLMPVPDGRKGGVVLERGGRPQPVLARQCGHAGPNAPPSAVSEPAAPLNPTAPAAAPPLPWPRPHRAAPSRPPRRADRPQGTFRPHLPSHGPSGAGGSLPAQASRPAADFTLAAGLSVPAPSPVRPFRR